MLLFVWMYMGSIWVDMGWNLSLNPDCGARVKGGSVYGANSWGLIRLWFCFCTTGVRSVCQLVLKDQKAPRWSSVYRRTPQWEVPHHSYRGTAEVTHRPMSQDRWRSRRESPCSNCEVQANWAGTFVWTIFSRRGWPSWLGTSCVSVRVCVYLC